MGAHMENALLYTFSTIPQTLGAAFAVLAAFVLYRFQAGSAALSELTRQAIEQLPGEPTREKAYAMLSEGKQSEFLQLVKSLKPPPTPGWQTVVLRNFLDAAEALKNAQEALRTAFLFTSGLILYSVITLCLDPQIARLPDTVAEMLLSLGALGVLVCLILYWGLLNRLMSR